MNLRLQSEGRIEQGTLLEVNDLRTQFRTERGLVRRRRRRHLLDRSAARHSVSSASRVPARPVLSRSIMGLLPSNAVLSGSVRFAGQEVLGLDAKQMRHLWGREMSMVFQNPMVSLNPVMKIGKQIVEPLQIHLGMTKSDAEADRRAAAA